MNLKDFIKAIVIFLAYILIAMAICLCVIVVNWAKFCGIILVICLAFHWPFSFGWVTLAFGICAFIAWLFESDKNDKH